MQAVHRVNVDPTSKSLAARASWLRMCSCIQGWSRNRAAVLKSSSLHNHICTLNTMSMSFAGCATTQSKRYAHSPVILVWQAK